MTHPSETPTQPIVLSLRHPEVVYRKAKPVGSGVMLNKETLYDESLPHVP